MEARCRLKRCVMTSLLSLSCWTLAGCAPAQSIYAPSGLRSVDKVHPVGTDDRPYFGWLVNDADDHEIQSAYQILVASSPDVLQADQGDLWDSGQVHSDRQNYVYYQGTPLAAATRYYWKTRTWDKDGHRSPYSEPACFDTGLFTSQDWSGARWIKRETNDRDDYTYYRKKVVMRGKPIARATVYVTAVHEYELYLNGRLVGKGPAFHYPQYQYYNAYDVTAELRGSRDLTLACLTHWYGGGQGRPTSARGFLLKAIIDFEDGSSATIGTDRTWKQIQVAAWDVTNPRRRGGEGIGYVDRIDARSILPDWNTQDFDDSAWAAAVEIGPPPTEPWTEPLQPDLTRLIEREITPTSVTDLGEGTYVIDLGKVYPGVPSITFHGGEPGSQVSIQGGYTLDDQGTILPRTNQSTDMSYTFTLNGDTALFQPKVYMGMRYLQVSHSPCTLTLDNVRFICRHYELDPSRSSFVSSDLMLNQVWDLMKHSLIVGCQEEFVDTPTREKGGFLGDSWAQAVPAMTTMGDRSMNPRVLLEFLDSQDQYWPDGRLNAVYPNVDRGRDIPDYTQSYLVWIWDYYMQTGHLEFLRANYARLKKVADYVDTYRSESTGLIHNLAGGGGAYLHGIIDWPAPMRYGYDMETESRTVVDAYAYLDFAIIARIAEALGNTADRDTYQAKANAMKQAINTQLINDQGVYIDGLYSDRSPSRHVSQHANMFPLAMGIVPEEHRDAVIGAVKERRMNCGMVTLRWLPESLGLADQGPHLIDLYTQTEWDGWARIIALGGTATWESWDAVSGTDSLSHPWGAVGLLGIQQFILGVTPLTPQYGTVQIKPLDFQDKLVSAAGTLPTDRGDITVDWGRSEHLFSMTLTLPPNMTARVYVPRCGTQGRILRVNDQEVAAAEDGDYLTVDSIGSGTHVFERIIDP